MTKEVNLSLSPRDASEERFILNALKEKDELKDLQVKSFKIIRRSIDARKKEIKVNLTIIVSDNPVFPIPERKKKTYKKISEDSAKIVIVGSGPAGLFAALRALENGLKPIVIERGKDVDSRRKDIALISRENKILEDSNFCFGEGGAGTFSDGKLYTRSKKRGNNREVLEILYQFGAEEDILINSHPHIGSDKLSKIIKNIRNKIIECGGEVRFNTKMTGIKIKEGKALGIYTERGEFIEGPVFLATGHSARDTYRLLASSGITLQPKGLAIGVRIEYPQKLIDEIQYHNKEGKGKYLPPAEFSFVSQAMGRGVYTFCMCPGGVIVPAISSSGQIVVNGMSASARSGKWANSGFVVELHPEDIKSDDENNCFVMMNFQEDLEKRFSEESRGLLNAPAQRIPDFINKRTSKDLPLTSYAPGIHSSDFNKLFPPQISTRLKKGLEEIGKKNKNFISPEGVMIGLESRTSSPVRIPRDPHTLNHIDIKDLYPMGEGAGYAGGIVSSAIDGIRCVDAYIQTH